MARPNLTGRTIVLPNAHHSSSVRVTKQKGLLNSKVDGVAVVKLPEGAEAVNIGRVSGNPYGSWFSRSFFVVFRRGGVLQTWTFEGNPDELWRFRVQDLENQDWIFEVETIEEIEVV